MMGLRLSDLPDHIRAKYEAQLAAEATISPMRQWHIEITLGEGDNAKVMKSKPSTDEEYVKRAFLAYMQKHPRSNARIVQSLTTSK